MSGASHQLEPFFGITSDDQSAVLVTVSLAAATISMFCMAAKLFWRRNMYSLKIYDYALLPAMILILPYTALSVFSASLGVGKHRQETDDSHQDTLRKVQYAINLLGILIAMGSKISTCLLIETINSYTMVHYANRIVLGIIAIISLTTFLGSALRCGLPQPWLALSEMTCPAAAPIYQFVLISNMVTDILICSLAIAMICRVQTKKRTRILVIALFCFRSVCPATTFPALFDTAHLYNRQDIDHTWLSLKPATWLAISTNCSVITACVPSLKGLFDTWLGNTLGIDIDAPYQLKRLSGKHQFGVTLYEQNAGCEGKSSDGRIGGGSNSASLAARKPLFSSAASITDGDESDNIASTIFATLKLSSSTTNQASCCSNGCTESLKKSTGQSKTRRCDDESSDCGQESDSVKRLTWGVAICEDVEVHFGESRRRRSSSDSRC
ncbi:hypothetical protein MN608_00741 [Microdochium nivale]|nr:hypothetical protein MN608_00741 [Microdochium nivale]